MRVKGSFILDYVKIIRARLKKITASRDEVEKKLGESKRAGEMLRGSEVRYRRLFETAKDGVLILDAVSGVIIDVNPFLCELLGFPRETFLEKRLWELGFFKDIIANENKFLELERQKYIRYDDLPLERSDGRRIDVEFVSNVYLEGNKKVIQCNIRDITERKRAKEALRESEERFRILFEKDTAGKSLTSPDGKLLKINSAFANMLGYTIKEMQQLNFAEITHPEDIAKSLECIRSLLANECSEYRMEKRYLHKSGSIVWAELSTTLLRDGKGAPLYLIPTIMNITDRKRAEEERAKLESELQQALKMEAVGQLAGGIAHDFNNMLTAIIGNISLAKVKVKGEESAYLNLDEAERAAMRAKELALQLLTFSRGGEPIMKPVTLGALLHDSCGFVLRNSKSVCEVSAPDDLWPVYADEGQLSQVFYNLLINADQAMPNGGKVNITSENMAIPGNNEWNLKPGRYVKISIRDNGVGIPRENLPKIFAPFFTTKKKGSGLGLAIIYSIISKHDGHISVESDPGVGATFSIYLPASDEIVQAKAVAEPEEQSLTGKGRILVMDDDDGIRRVAFNLLDYMGHEVSLAKNGEEAIELYQKAKDSGKPFDLLIIDLVVDNGMGGQEAMEILRRIDPQVKAIVSSGYSTDPVMSDFAKYGFVGVITKPYGINKLKEALRDILPKSSPKG